MGERKLWIIEGKDWQIVDVQMIWEGEMGIMELGGQEMEGFEVVRIILGLREGKEY